MLALWAHRHSHVRIWSDKNAIADLQTGWRVYVGKTSAPAQHDVTLGCSNLPKDGPSNNWRRAKVALRQERRTDGPIWFYVCSHRGARGQHGDHDTRHNRFQHAVDRAVKK